MILAKPNHPSPHVFIMGKYLNWRKGFPMEHSRFCLGNKADWKYWTLIAPTELDTWKDKEDDV